VEEASIFFLCVLLKEGLQLVNVDSKQSGGKRAPLLHPNGATDELR